MRLALLLAAFTALAPPAGAQLKTFAIEADGPRTLIINAGMLPDGPNEGDSINGPSLIRVPSWVKKPLGKYYLYFAHHTGRYIRLAYADRVEGPWRVYTPGALRIEDQSVVSNHIASPEAVIDEARKEIVLFYHGQVVRNGEKQGQFAAAAVSSDGLHFTPFNQIAGEAYLRVFRYRDKWYSLAASGELGTSGDLHEPFTVVARVIGDEILDPLYPKDLSPSLRHIKGHERFSIRHIGLDLVGNHLIVYFTCVGQTPEHIMATRIDLSGPESSWKAEGTLDVLSPKMQWEGATVPMARSFGGKSIELENSLRDPEIFRDEGRAWLVYAAGGEHGMGVVSIRYEEPR